VTFPLQLHGLLEITCRLMLHDGTHPEIVLQPDRSTAHTLLLQIWQKLRSGLASIDEIGDFNPALRNTTEPRAGPQRPSFSGVVRRTRMGIRSLRGWRT